MTKTILITGASSGIGLNTSLYFAEKGWKVIATMRNPEKRTTPLHNKENIDLIHLDVIDSELIKNVIKFCIDKYKNIDALLNNAGYALVGPFELYDKNKIKKQMETNVIGLMEMTKALIPHLRQKQCGVIVNISSIGGKNGVPLYSVYNASKWAVEGFSEALYFELLNYNIKVKIIEPGFISSSFLESQDLIDINEWGTYREKLQGTMESLNSGNGSSPVVVAKTIYKAITSNNNKLRYPVGKMAKPAVIFRKLLPENLFLKILKKTYRL